MPDADLLGQFVRSKSEEAFAALVRRHISLVHSVARRHTANEHNAEEISQAVFIILTRKAQDLPPGTLLSGWLYRTARLTAANFQRSESRRARREQEAYMQSTLNEAPHEAAWRELAPLLDEELERLGQTDRDAIVLRYFENRSLRDVGRALGMEERAAQKRVSRALEKLRSFFAKRGVAVTAATIAGAVAANSVQAAPPRLAVAISMTALKGSAVAASTMALANETIKFMTWLKLKFAAGVAGVVLLTGGALTLASLAVKDAKAPDIEGAWEGFTTADGTSIQPGEPIHTRLVVRFFKTNGSYRATVDAIDSGQKDIPIDKVVYDFPSLQLESSQLFAVNRGLTMKGTVNAEGTEMVWHDTVHWGVLKRTRTPTQVAKRLAENQFTPRDDSDLQGYWKGRLGAGRGGLPLYWKIAEDSNGVFRAELDNPMQGDVSQPVSVVYNPPAVDLIVNSGSGMFHGTIDSEKALLTGSWIQGGVFTPASFRREIYQPDSTANSEKSYAFAFPTEVQGHWQGMIQTKDFKLRLVLDIAKLPDGTFEAALISPDTPGNSSPIPATRFQYSPPNVLAEWKWIDGVLNATLENGKLAGTLKVGALGLGATPLALARKPSQ